MIWNWVSEPAWLAVTMPAPSSKPPQSTTARVPKRSDSAPQRNEPMPMQSQLRSAAVETPVRDQPVASDMGWRKMLSESIEPTPMQVTTMPAPTMTQP